MTIHDTPLVPYLIAEKAVHKYMADKKLGMQSITFDRYCAFLENKSERIFDTNTSWRDNLLKSKDERQYLFGFMYHWLDAEINRPKEPLLQIEMFHNINPQLNLFC